MSSDHAHQNGNAEPTPGQPDGRVPGTYEVTVADTREAARSVVAQLERQVLLAMLSNDPHPLGSLWANCLAVLGAQAQNKVPEAL
ncbi:hypothetical protein [Nonomuraea sp. KM90]|uniref:hypothetical protein n=1 Tax=Nonomuraea sp. KM90 TaxID=3457428 RepID=UPI003FCE1F0D